MSRSALPNSGLVAIAAVDLAAVYLTILVVANRECGRGFESFAVIVLFVGFSVITLGLIYIIPGFIIAAVAQQSALLRSAAFWTLTTSIIAALLIAGLVTVPSSSPMPAPQRCRIDL
jgi:hypothetical protein